MKKLLSIVIVAVLVLGLVTPASAETAQSKHSDKLVINTLEFVRNHMDEQSLDNYLYIQMVRDFLENETAITLYSAADILVSQKAGDIWPDSERYMETLLRLFSLYEQDSASIIYQKNVADNTRTWKDWTLDATEIVTGSLGVLIGNAEASKEFSDWLEMAIGILQTEAENMDHYIDTFSKLQTQWVNLVRFQSYLTKLSTLPSADDALKDAAVELNSCLTSVMQIKLENFVQILDDNFENTGEYIFTDLVWDMIPKSSIYENDETVRWFVDKGSNVMKLLGSWQFGDAIGRFAGNLIVSGEDLNTRMKEMITLRQIAIPTLDLMGSYLSKIESLSATTADELLTLYELYAITNLRGEYCLTSILISDAGLTNWWSKITGNSQKAEQWYESQSVIIKGIIDDARTARATDERETVDIKFTCIEFWDNNTNTCVEQAVIEAVDSNGNTQWTFSTDTYELAQLHSVLEIGRTASQYYFCERGTIVALDVCTGEVLWRNDEFAGMPINEGACYVDTDGTIYLCGYLNPDFFAVDVNGKTLCRIHSFSPEYYWAYKLEKDKNALVIYLENGPNGYNKNGYLFYVNPNDFSYVSKSILDNPRSVYREVSKKANNEVQWSGSGLFIDINQDGREELLMVYTLGNNMVWSIYTTDGSHAIPLVETQEMYPLAGGPSHLVGTINYNGSLCLAVQWETGETGGIASRKGEWVLYELSEGCLIEIEHVEYWYEQSINTIESEKSGCIIGNKEETWDAYIQWKDRLLIQNAIASHDDGNENEYRLSDLCALTE